MVDIPDALKARGASKTVTIDDEAVLAALGRVVEAGEDLSPLMADIASALLLSTQQRFETKAGPDGRPWAGYARSTLRQMSPKRKVPQLLRDSGLLYASIQTVSTAAEAKIGSNLVYAAIHQFGGAIKRAARTRTIYRRYDEKTDTISGFVRRSRSNFAQDVAVGAHEITIPARPYLGLSQADREEIVAVAADYVARAGGLSGGGAAGGAA